MLDVISSQPFGALALVNLLVLLTVLAWQISGVLFNIAGDLFKLSSGLIKRLRGGESA